jgi:hypothetical protein
MFINAIRYFISGNNKWLISDQIYDLKGDPGLNYPCNKWLGAITARGNYAILKVLFSWQDISVNKISTS